jgi:hypothetical protein
MLDTLKKAWELVAGDTSDELVELWATDEDAFADHFGATYQTFVERVDTISRADHELYEKTFKVNPEAAVTWVFFLTGPVT